MNKKQAVIIMTLLVLIICAGVIATKMNDNLYVNVDDQVRPETTISSNLNKTSDYFAESKLLKTTNRNSAITTCKSLAEDKNISQENRNTASAKAMKYAENALAESKIEADLKGKGYGDVICWIEDDPLQVRIAIKAKDTKDKLTDQQSRSIYDIATSLSHIKTIKIELKQ
ncbi:MAG: SpoIIIAH-like family protein [Clostridiaceae bacterium]|nr:SpoIIIAH-like family protein [Clostridiaceae bacterium]